MPPLISIVICTYDRLEILQDCLQAFDQQVEEIQDLYEIIIVNNHVGQEKEIRNRINLQSNWTLITEPKEGLSRARNKGISIAKGQWIGFVDDDALPPRDFLSKAKEIIEKGGVDCFGGDIRSWWKYPRPRWLSPEYGSKPKLSDTPIILTEAYNWGSNIFIKKDALEEVGCFPEYIGMKGKKIGYAAENIVQKKLREKGYIVSYDPTFYVDHLVHPNKLKLKWHIRAAYATARDGVGIYPEDYEPRGMMKTVRRIVAAPTKGIFKIWKSGYYWENWLLDSIIPWAQLVGKLRAIASS